MYTLETNMYADAKNSLKMGVAVQRLHQPRISPSPRAQVYRVGRVTGRQAGLTGSTSGANRVTSRARDRL